MKKQKIIFTVAVIVGLGFIGNYATSIWPQYNDKGPEIAETEEINTENSIGGVAKGSSQSSYTTYPPAMPAVTQDSQTKIETIAPRQAEIKNTTKVEYLYRALRTSNDPLPQPTWVRSTTKIEAAWNTTTGNGVVVAVIDSGFALDHEDLTSQWFINNGESGTTTTADRCWSGTSIDKATNNCDDDNNGYKDDWRGWDFVKIDNTPQAGETNPNGAGVAHGTEVAGLVGAAGNNAVGTAGLSWNNKIMPLQALGDDGSGYTSSVAAAVYYAADNGAAVINLSLGGETNDPTLADAITYAYEKGVVVVAAAGNCGTGEESGCDPSKPGAMSYPALNPYVIAVGASTSSNLRASFSSYGPGLDVMAPGSGTLVSPMWQPSNQTSAYATSLYGTSFASPMVASYVGLLKSIRPGTNVEDMTALVNATASKPSGMASSLYTTQFGHGIIDTESGIRVATSLNQSISEPNLLQTGNEVSEHSFRDTSLMSSGCKTLTPAYCTVWARNSLGYDRFLPYTLTTSEGHAGWSWRGDWLQNGGWWSLKARSGINTSSTPYPLLNK